MCVSAQAFAPSFIGQGLALRQAHGSALSMKIELAPLPYGMHVCMYVCMHVCMYVCMHDITYVCTHTGYTDLEPKIGKRTLEIHHDKVFSLCVFYM